MMTTMTATETANTYVRRLLGAVALDAGTFEEVESDKSAMAQAFATVVLSSLAAGIGWGGANGTTPASIAFFGTVALLAWGAWSLVTFEVGTRILAEPQTQSDPGELLRTIGFASAPGMLRIVGVLPELRTPVFALTSVWMLLAMVVAVRQALDYTTTRRAVAVCLLGWALALVLAVVLGMVFETRLLSAALG